MTVRPLGARVANRQLFSLLANSGSGLVRKWGHIRHFHLLLFLNCSLSQLALTGSDESTHFNQCHHISSFPLLICRRQNLLFMKPAYISPFIDIGRPNKVSEPRSNLFENAAFCSSCQQNQHCRLDSSQEKKRMAASLCLSLHQTLSTNPLAALRGRPLSLSFPGSSTVSIRPSGRHATAVTTRASYTPTPATERVISIASYALPFFNSLQYGRFLFAQYPRLGLLFEPIFPILNLYRSVPYASFVAFFGLYLGVVRNTSLSRYVRFNAMQAVTLDVLLAVPVLLTRILDPGQGGGFGMKAMMWGHSGVFVFSFMCFVYGVVSCLLGKTPYIPFVADAAGRQL